MKNPFPKQIRTIGIAAPASSADPLKFQQSAETLRECGIHLVQSRHLFTKTPHLSYVSAPEKERIQDLNELIRNPDIDLILCIRGGYGTPKILDQIDWETLQKRNLPIVGFSDITALHLAMMNRHAGIPIAGQMAARLAEAMQNSFTYHSFQRALSLLAKPKTALTEHFSLHKIKEGTCSGEIVPVNLTLLTALCGTPFLPDLSGKILILEDIGEPLRKIDRHLTQLRLSGVLEKLAGLVFAQFTDCEDPETRLLLFKEFADSIPGPVLAGLPFGHEIPSLSFLYGESGLIHEDSIRF